MSTVMSPTTLSITAIKTPWADQDGGQVYRQDGTSWQYLGPAEPHLPATALDGSGTLMVVTSPKVDVFYWDFITTVNGDVHFDGPYQCRA